MAREPGLVDGEGVARCRGSPTSPRCSGARGCCRARRTPGSRSKRFGARRSCGSACPCSRRIAVDEVLDEQRDVLAGARAEAARGAGTRSAGRTDRRGSGPRRTAAGRSRLVAAMTRTSTGIGAPPPTRSNCPLLQHAQAAPAASPAGRSPISSRKIVPSWASSKRPRRCWRAPVKAPLLVPEQLRGDRATAGIAAQLTLTNARSARRERLWMARAMSSLPVPVSPAMSTVESVGATIAMLVSSGLQRGRGTDDLLEHGRAARSLRAAPDSRPAAGP